MITTAVEYYKELYRIQDENFPSLAILLPQDEKIYNINLNSRVIEIPEYLSVATDHKAETIYFKVDRFYKYMDLTSTVCVIQYINAIGESHYYPVPFYDAITFADEDKILIPWNISGNATKAAGNVKFSIRFYRIDLANHHFVYNLNTLPAVGKVLYGLNPDEFKPEDYEIAADRYEIVMQEIADIKQKVIDQLYWLSIDEINNLAPQ